MKPYLYNEVSYKPPYVVGPTPHGGLRPASAGLPELISPIETLQYHNVIEILPHRLTVAHNLLTS